MKMLLGAYLASLGGYALEVLSLPHVSLSSQQAARPLILLNYSTCI